MAKYQNSSINADHTITVGAVTLNPALMSAVQRYQRLSAEEKQENAFLATFTTEQFKSLAGLKPNEAMEVLPSNIEGKFFLSYGPSNQATMPVCWDKIDDQHPAVISLVAAKEGCTEENPAGLLWLMHAQGAGSKKAIATF